MRKTIIIVILLLLAISLTVTIYWRMNSNRKENRSDLAAGIEQRGMQKITGGNSEKRVALVIGNANYKESPLNNPVNDAQDMAKSLRKLGFAVIFKVNASQKEMDKSLNEFSGKLRNGCISLFYYSGHGLQFEGENYLIPVDANVQREVDIKYTSLSVDKVIDYMNDSNNDGMNIVILDACRNNPFRMFRTLSRGLAETKSSRGFIIGYATSPGSVAADGTGRNGTYTKHLLSAVKIPGLIIEDVFKRVRKETDFETNGKQTPWESSSLVGDFYFTPFNNVVKQVEYKNEALHPTVDNQSLNTNPPKERTGKDGAPMVLIPAGEFQMGSNDGNKDEKQVHTVYLDGFYMDKYEVKNEQYEKFIKSIGYKLPIYWNDSRFNSPNQPVVGINWYDAKVYSDWAGKRLPTEAEWEKAACGGLMGNKYPWGNQEPDGTQCNFADKNTEFNWSNKNANDNYQFTAPVGCFNPNGYGLYDMAGNVWEYCEDWYDSKYYMYSPKQNPKGPTSGKSCVVRGGSWNTSSRYLRISNRDYYTKITKTNRGGFRCVQYVSK